jgi:RHS repeat-associated protein
MTDPAGNPYSYTYNENGNLASVTYPDETPSDPSDNPSRRYHYEDAAHPDALTGITDERGVLYVTWTYDAQGRATSSSRAGGADRVTLTYDDSTGTSTLTDALGEVRTYSFETTHDRIQVSAVSGAPCSSSCSNSFAGYSYDANGYPASRTDHNGNLTTFVYDARGLETSRTEAVGTPEERTTAARWHTMFRLPELITAPGKSTAFTYDSQGRLLTRTETDTFSGRSRTVTNTYNARGLLATQDGPRTDVADVTTLAYDAQGNLAETTNALDHANRFTDYDAHGRPLRMEDQNGLITLLAYDSRGRLISREAGGQLTGIEYDGVGNVTRTSLPGGSILVSEYDDANRLVAIEDNFANRTEFSLDAMGNRIGETVRDPTSAITRKRSRVFDTFNRLIQTIGGADQLTEFEYDLQGNQTAVIDGNNARTVSGYDALNRLVTIIDPNSGETTFDFDDRDNLVSVTDATGLATHFTYDGLENLTLQSSPDTGLTQFAYDAAGNRIAQTDARGVEANFKYDALNRLVFIGYPDTAKNIEFEYDSGSNGVGRLTHMTDASGSTDIAYDIRGNLDSETRTIDGVAYVTAYTYDSADRVLTITYPSGTIVTYTRDALGRIDTVSATTDGVTQLLASNIAYLPFGPMEEFDYGNGIPLTRAFDQDYRLIAQTAGGVQDLSLDYDSANNITTLIDGLDSARSQSFGYDGLNRLTRGEGIYGIRDYSYDGIGNRLSLSSSAGLDTYDFDSNSHRLEGITGPNGTSFSYDANGNTVTKGPLSFTYDDTNRMTEAHASGVRLATYTYNARGERVKKTGEGGSSTPTETVLFSDNFSAPDGTVIDDLAGGQWLGKRPEATISATVAADAAQVAPGEAIRTSKLFTDTGDTLLVVRARLMQGTLVLKRLGLRQGVRIRFNGKRRVAVTSGVFNDETKSTKTIFRLPDLSRHIDVELSMRAGTAHVTVTDDRGNTYDTGDLSGAASSSNDTYRLKLRAIKVRGGAVPGFFDDVQVSRGRDVGSAGAIHFVFDPDGNLIGEYDAVGSSKVEYVYIENQPLAMIRGGAIYYYHTDQLGTPQILTDYVQEIVWRANYTPFGDTTFSANIIDNSLRFPGQYFDAEAGLHYNYFRDYDPGIGRYLQSDPIGLEGGANLYLYGLSNPVRFTDSLGLDVYPIQAESPSAPPMCGVNFSCHNPIVVTFTDGVKGARISKPVTRTFSLDCLVTIGIVEDLKTTGPLVFAQAGSPAVEKALIAKGFKGAAKVVVGTIAGATSLPATILLGISAVNATLDKCECGNLLL